MFFKNYFLKEKIKQNSYFIWDNKNKNIQIVKKFKPLDLNLIIGVDNQKEILFKNTRNFNIACIKVFKRRKFNFAQL